MEWEVGELTEFLEEDEEIICLGCGELIESEDWTYVLIREDGEREFYCASCGEEAEDEDAEYEDS